MTRDLNQLTARTFDLLVVGGGIYGLTMACDAAQRGLSVALVERGDFGGGASFNHLRTIHGGLRYLQTLDFARARESVHERRTLARIAPQAVRPLAFVLPLARSFARGKLAMRAGLLLDRLIAKDRNLDLPASHQLTAGRVISRREAQRRYPLLADRKITGAAVWHDYAAVEADRLTLAWALSAAEHGAALANYVEATAVIRDGRRVCGVRATDVFSRSAIEIAARVVVNATGAGVDALIAPLGIATAGPMLKAMNLVTTRPGGDAAIGSRSGSGRNYFMVPWRGRALFGTWESASPCSPDAPAVVERDVEAFVVDLNAAYPGLNLRRAEVSLVHHGIVPAKVRGADVALEGHERVRDHARDKAEGLITVAGTKYTTARATAERIVDLVCEKLGRRGLPSRSATMPLPWPDEIGDDLLVQAARREMVVTLADAIVRRTPLGALGQPDDATLRHAAAVVGRELGWSEDRQLHEMAAVRKFYQPRH